MDIVKCCLRSDTTHELVGGRNLCRHDYRMESLGGGIGRGTAERNVASVVLLEARRALHSGANSVRNMFAVVVEHRRIGGPAEIHCELDIAWSDRCK